MGELSLQQLRAQPERWLKHQLDPENPDQMRQILEEVARVKSVTPTSARMLGFDEQMLELDRANPDQVLIPAWRNAQISIRHPLFERGLRILDTPGLNALGSEPELTISLLPKAHAIIFVISADHLGIQPQDVIPVSAKQGLIGRVKNDFELFQRSGIEQLEELIIQRSSRRLVEAQGVTLQGLVAASHFETQVTRVRDNMSKIWTTVGMNRAIDPFFDGLEGDLSHLLTESRLAERMVAAICKRYSNDPGARHMETTPLRAGRHVIAIRQLRQKAERFRSNPRNLLTEQSVLVRRFSNLMISEVRNLYLLAQKDAERWPRQALLPVMQYTLEQKQLLQHQIGRLKELAHNDRHGRAEKKRLENAISDLQRQLELAEAIHRQIRKPAPTLSQQKVVNLSSTM